VIEKLKENQKADVTEQPKAQPTTGYEKAKAMAETLPHRPTEKNLEMPSPADVVEQGDNTIDPDSIPWWASVKRPAYRVMWGGLGNLIELCL